MFATDVQGRPHPALPVAYPAWSVPESGSGVGVRPRHLALGDADHALKGTALVPDPGPATEQYGDHDGEDSQIDAQYRQQRDKHAAILRAWAADCLPPGG